MREVRRGDMWEFTTNNGILVRHVRSVACGRVFYVCNGRFMQCAIEIFNRFAKGAELTFREPIAPPKAAPEETHSFTLDKKIRIL